MKKKLLPFVVIIMLLTTPVLSAEGDTLKPAALFVHPDAAGKLPLIGTVAITISGVDRTSARLIEDAIAIALLADSITVLYPGQKDLNRERPVPPDPVAWAKKLGANTLITGTLVARCGHCARGKSGCRDERVRAVSFYLVDVPQDKILLWALYEPSENTPPSGVVNNFVRIMKESLTEKEEK